MDSFVRRLSEHDAAPGSMTGNATAAAAAAAAAANAVVAATATGNGAPDGSESRAACQLLATSFGWWLQAILGAVCFVSLVGKRFTDRVRRPWKVWFFDTSKQGISAMLVHFSNILLSMAFGEWLDADVDPCNWYWVNLTLDDTVGIGLQFVFLRSLQRFYRTKCIGRPELALSGEYGNPPSVRIFGRQLLDWSCLVAAQKVTLAVFVVNCTSHVAAVADFLLGWLDLYPRAKLVTVMVITPLVMNVFALWIADSFLQGDPYKAGIEEARARASLVRGEPDVVGQRGRASAGLDEHSGDESEGVVGFQEWKQRRSRMEPLSVEGGANHQGQAQPHTRV